MILGHAEQFPLEGCGEFAYLIKKYGPFIGDLKITFFVRIGPRKSALRISKKLAFKQTFG